MFALVDQHGFEHRADTIFANANVSDQIGCSAIPKPTVGL